MEQHAKISKNIINKMIEKRNNGLSIKPMFSDYDGHPYDQIEWELRNASITNENNEIIFEANSVEFPKSWSQIATNVVASKYFTGGPVGSKERETSVKVMIERVARTIADWGMEDGYFCDESSCNVFYRELSDLLLNQKASFNSPVWFNCGVESSTNQFSACFINSVEDTMSSILDLAKTEGMLFKWGSGTGTNLSTIRSSSEGLSGGGTASGPVSFMKGYDAFAGVIKSGGKTRRAAKMVILNADHPDIKEFINSKALEEKKAHALINAGYDGSFNGEAYNSIAFQNANHSVRVDDEFMERATNDKEWKTKAVVSKEYVSSLKAKELLMDIADATYVCGDPGLQFDTTINKWHTCPNSGKINSSNPCSEYMFLDDSACNLASLNLMKFRSENKKGTTEEDTFNFVGFSYAVSIMIIAQEILVSHATYPGQKITQNSLDYRPLGLGYANLGALLMSKGYAYDSVEGRNYAALITSIMCGAAYKMSSVIASVQGPFKHYKINSKPMLNVVDMHRKASLKLMDSVEKLGRDKDKAEAKILFDISNTLWDDAYNLGKEYGYRNSQTTVLAPTGTIAFMMDCDTTGIEPDIALVKYKKLVGGGLLKIVNQTIAMALENFNYKQEEINSIIKYIDSNDTIEGCPELKKEHLSIFDCAFKPTNGTRNISYMGHIKMMEAIQPFLSGAISKTINMDSSVTKDDIYYALIEAWKRGLKSIAIYRDGSKLVQPLSTTKEDKTKEKTSQTIKRRILPEEREAITHKFSVGGHDGYVTAGMYKDGTLGELFIVMAKEGSVVSGLMDSFATSVSLALQYGVPLEILVDKFVHTRFEPSGYTSNKAIPIAKSIMDYIFRWLSIKFLNKNPVVAELEDDVELKTAEGYEISSSSNHKEEALFKYSKDANPCAICGSIMIRNGSCYRCLNCGSTSGCS